VAAYARQQMGSVEGEDRRLKDDGRINLYNDMYMVR